MIDRACISLSEKCNMNCRYCYFENSRHNNNANFSVDNIKLILGNIYNYCQENSVKSFKIGLVGAGEPLMQFELIKEIVLYAETMEFTEIKFYTITNGLLATKKKLEFFFEHKETIKLRFSLDGYKELHDFTRGHFDEIFSNINSYKEIYSCMPPINCTVNKITIENKEKVLDFFSDNNFESVTFSRLVDCENQELFITREEFDSFLKVASEYKFAIRQFDKVKQKKYDCTIYGTKCSVGKTNLFFAKNGIFPCGRFYGNEEYNFGYFDSPLAIIQEKMKKLQKVYGGECCYEKYVEGNNEK